MSRFIALVWNDLLDVSRERAAALGQSVRVLRPDWTASLQAPGLMILEAPARSRAELGLNLGAHEGRLVGAVFGAESARRLQGDEINIRDLRRSGAAALFTGVWGRYVAFVRDVDEACVYVARDPSGACECYYGHARGVFTFFSDPDDLDILGFEGLRFDWGYLCARLRDNRLVSTRSGFEQVSLLAPGAIARVGQGRIKMRRAWSPWEIAARAEPMPRPRAIALLRQRVETACQGWASCYDAAAVRLSGGLDSAIVAGACAGRIGAFSALNLVTPTSEGDERAFAGAAAAQHGLALRVAFRDPQSVDLAPAAEIAASARPPLWLADGDTDRLDAACAREAGLQAFFSGRGGDNVFFRTERGYALGDLLLHGGPGRRWRQAVLAHARARRAPALATAREAIQCAFARNSTTLGQGGGELVSEAARALALPPTAPTPFLPPGKGLHVAIIEDRLNYFDRRAHADYVYPLVSQPVLEAVLRLPTFDLAEGAADRGLARAAFADLVPPSILQRKSKGQTTGYLTHILLRNRAFLRSFLLEGILSDAGMLNRAMLEAYLTEAGLMRMPRLQSPLVGVFGVEAWLRAHAKAGRVR